MSDKTKIEWTDATWNPITGCSVVSPGCKHCYAMKLAGTRLQHHTSRSGLTVDTPNGPVWSGEVRFNEQWLSQPLRWKRPRMIFVCAHADLFHESVPDFWIDLVFSAMELSPQHRFQVLTKRPVRMRDYIKQSSWGHSPLPNVWLGVSVENQDCADARIPVLLDTPAAVRWISAEPLLGPITLRWLEAFPENAKSRALSPGGSTNHLDGLRRLDWVVVGGESGTNSRPMHPEWVRSLRDECAAANVQFLFKQWGGWRPATASELCDGIEMVSVGKKAAGRLLDGVQYDGYPFANNPS